MSRYSIPRLKILLISCMAAMGLFAVNAVGAQAASWYYNGALLSGSKTVASTNGAHGALPALGSFKLEGKLLGNAVTITCTGESDTGTITAPSSDSDTITWSGCSAAAPYTACKVQPEVTNAKTSLVTVGGKLYDKFEPATAGGAFTYIIIEGCAIAGEWEVEGSTAAYDSASGTESETHTLQFSKTISAEAGTALTFAGQPAYLTGKSYVWLTAGGKFSAK